MQDRYVTDGQAVYLAGDPPDSIFVVLQGHVIMTAFRSAGARLAQAFGPGSVFGPGSMPGRADPDPLPRVTAHGITVVRIYSAEEARVSAATGRDQTELLMAAILQAGKAEARTAVPTALAEPRHNGEARDQEAENDPAEDALGDETLGDETLVRLVVTDPEIADLIEYPELDIELFPFVIGREDGKSRKQSVDLAIPNKAPFQLSRRHFMIEDGVDGFEVVDCGSYHGTLVNGAKLGNDSTAFRAVLNPGENEIVAGSSSSPFRFVIVLEGDAAP
jgi:hypothetical protein